MNARCRTAAALAAVAAAVIVALLAGVGIDSASNSNAGGLNTAHLNLDTAKLT